MSVATFVKITILGDCNRLLGKRSNAEHTLVALGENSADEKFGERGPLCTAPG